MHGCVLSCAVGEVGDGEAQKAGEAEEEEGEEEGEGEGGKQGGS